MDNQQPITPQPPMQPAPPMQPEPAVPQNIEPNAPITTDKPKGKGKLIAIIIIIILVLGGGAVAAFFLLGNGGNSSANLSLTAKEIVFGKDKIITPYGQNESYKPTKVTSCGTDCIRHEYDGKTIGNSSEDMYKDYKVIGMDMDYDTLSDNNPSFSTAVTLAAPSLDSGKYLSIKISMQADASTGTASPSSASIEFSKRDGDLEKKIEEYCASAGLLATGCNTTSGGEYEGTLSGTYEKTYTCNSEIDYETYTWSFSETTGTINGEEISEMQGMLTKSNPCHPDGDTAYVSGSAGKLEYLGGDDYRVKLVGDSKIYSITAVQGEDHITVDGETFYEVEDWDGWEVNL